MAAIAGDVDPDRALAAAAEQFGTWSGHSRPAPAPPGSAHQVGLRVRLVDDPAHAGAEIRITSALPGRVPARLMRIAKR